MSVLVTGASGHVGGNLVRALLARGRRVRALIRQDRRAIDGLDVEIAYGDVRDLDALRKACAGVDVVYHLAAHISLLPQERSLMEAINVTGVRNVVDACLACGVRRLVHFSSIHAMEQEPFDDPIDETRPLVASRSYPPYDRSKALGEKEVYRGVRQGLDAVILTPTGIIGPHDYRPSHFGAALVALSQGRLLALVEGGFDWVDVRDVAWGAMQAEKLARAGEKFILSGRWLSVQAISEMVAEITGVQAPGLVIPMWLARIGAPIGPAITRLTGGRSLYNAASLKALRGNPRILRERAGTALNYRPRPIRQTLEDTLGWFQQAGYLVPS